MRRSVALLAISLAALSVVPARAQSTDLARTPYYLSTKSTFQRGCLDPCACPSEQVRPVLGVFFLDPAGADPLFTYYDVADIQWVVLPLGQLIRITGSVLAGPDTPGEVDRSTLTGPMIAGDPA
jgi:hypothetical protein